MVTANSAFWEATTLVAIALGVLVISTVHLNGWWPKWPGSSAAATRAAASALADSETLEAEKRRRKRSGTNEPGTPGAGGANPDRSGSNHGSGNESDMSGRSGSGSTRGSERGERETPRSDGSEAGRGGSQGRLNGNRDSSDGEQDTSDSEGGGRSNKVGGAEATTQQITEEIPLSDGSTVNLVLNVKDNEKVRFIKKRASGSHAGSPPPRRWHDDSSEEDEGPAVGGGGAPGVSGVQPPAATGPSSRAPPTPSEGQTGKQHGGNQVVSLVSSGPRREDFLLPEEASYIPTRPLHTARSELPATPGGKQVASHLSPGPLREPFMMPSDAPFGATRPPTNKRSEIPLSVHVLAAGLPPIPGPHRSFEHLPAFDSTIRDFPAGQRTRMLQGTADAASISSASPQGSFLIQGDHPVTRDRLLDLSDPSVAAPLHVRQVGILPISGDPRAWLHSDTPHMDLKSLQSEPEAARDFVSLDVRAAVPISPEALAEGQTHSYVDLDAHVQGGKLLHAVPERVPVSPIKVAFRDRLKQLLPHRTGMKVPTPLVLSTQDEYVVPIAQSADAEGVMAARKKVREPIRGEVSPIPQTAELIAVKTKRRTGKKVGKGIEVGQDPEYAVAETGAMSAKARAKLENRGQEKAEVASKTAKVSKEKAKEKAGAQIKAQAAVREGRELLVGTGKAEVSPTGVVVSASASEALSGVASKNKTKLKTKKKNKGKTVLKALRSESEAVSGLDTKSSRIDGNKLSRKNKKKKKSKAQTGSGEDVGEEQTVKSQRKDKVLEEESSGESVASEISAVTGRSKSSKKLRSKVDGDEKARTRSRKGHEGDVSGEHRKERSKLRKRSKVAGRELVSDISGSEDVDIRLSGRRNRKLSLGEDRARALDSSHRARIKNRSHRRRLDSAEYVSSEEVDRPLRESGRSRVELLDRVKNAPKKGLRRTLAEENVSEEERLSPTSLRHVRTQAQDTAASGGSLPRGTTLTTKTDPHQTMVDTAEEGAPIVTLGSAVPLPAGSSIGGVPAVDLGEGNDAGATADDKSRLRERRGLGADTVRPEDQIVEVMVSQAASAAPAPMQETMVGPVPPSTEVQNEEKSDYASTLRSNRTANANRRAELEAAKAQAEQAARIAEEARVETERQAGEESLREPESVDIVPEREDTKAAGANVKGPEIIYTRQYTSVQFSLRVSADPPAAVVTQRGEAAPVGPPAVTDPAPITHITDRPDEAEVKPESMEKILEDTFTGAQDSGKFVAHAPPVVPLRPLERDRKVTAHPEKAPSTARDQPVVPLDLEDGAPGHVADNDRESKVTGGQPDEDVQDIGAIPWQARRGNRRIEAARIRESESAARAAAALQAKQAATSTTPAVIAPEGVTVDGAHMKLNHPGMDGYGLPVGKPPPVSKKAKPYLDQTTEQSSSTHVAGASTMTAEQDETVPIVVFPLGTDTREGATSDLTRGVAATEPPLEDLEHGAKQRGGRDHDDKEQEDGLDKMTTMVAAQIEAKSQSERLKKQQAARLRVAQQKARDIERNSTPFWREFVLANDEIEPDVDSRDPGDVRSAEQGKRGGAQLGGLEGDKNGWGDLDESAGRPRRAPGNKPTAKDMISFNQADTSINGSEPAADEANIPASSGRADGPSIPPASATADGGEGSGMAADSTTKQIAGDLARILKVSQAEKIPPARIVEREAKRVSQELQEAKAKRERRKKQGARDASGETSSIQSGGHEPVPPNVVQAKNIDGRDGKLEMAGTLPLSHSIGGLGEKVAEEARGREAVRQVETRGTGTEADAKPTKVSDQQQSFFYPTSESEVESDGSFWDRSPTQAATLQLKASHNESRLADAAGRQEVQRTPIQPTGRGVPQDGIPETSASTGIEEPDGEPGSEAAVGLKDPTVSRSKQRRTEESKGDGTRVTAEEAAIMLKEAKAQGLITVIKDEDNVKDVHGITMEHLQGILARIPNESTNESTVSSVPVVVRAGRDHVRGPGSKITQNKAVFANMPTKGASSKKKKQKMTTKIVEDTSIDKPGPVSPQSILVRSARYVGSVCKNAPVASFFSATSSAGIITATFQIQAYRLLLSQTAGLDQRDDLTPDSALLQSWVSKVPGVLENGEGAAFLLLNVWIALGIPFIAVSCATAVDVAGAPKYPGGYRGRLKAVGRRVRRVGGWIWAAPRLLLGCLKVGGQALFMGVQLRNPFGALRSGGMTLVLKLVLLLAAMAVTCVLGYYAVQAATLANSTPIKPLGTNDKSLSVDRFSEVAGSLSPAVGFGIVHIFLLIAIPIIAYALYSFFDPEADEVIRPGAARRSWWKVLTGIPRTVRNFLPGWLWRLLFATAILVPFLTVACFFDFVREQVTLFLGGVSGVEAVTGANIFFFVMTLPAMWAVLVVWDLIVAAWSAVWARIKW